MATTAPVLSVPPMLASSPPQIPVMERLIRTHPVWYLPNIGRAGAVHLLQNREAGIFLVRQSSHPQTMALSVRIGMKPRVEHYLIENTASGLQLEGSSKYFSAIPVLIAHYTENFDELPLKLCLPSAIVEAKTHQELTSLALLGQDFWTSQVSAEKESTNSVSTCDIPVFTAQPTVTSTSTRQFQATSHTRISMSTKVKAPDMIQQQQLSQNKARKTSETLATMSSTTLVVPPKERQTRPQSACFSSSFVTSVGEVKSSVQLPSTFKSGIKSSSSTNNLSVLNENSSNENTVAQPTVQHRYYKSNLSDKLSDYEDVWRSPSPEKVLSEPFRGKNKTSVSSVAQSDAPSITSNLKSHGNVNFMYVSQSSIEDEASKSQCDRTEKYKDKAVFRSETRFHQSVVKQRSENIVSQKSVELKRSLCHSTSGKNTEPEVSPLILMFHLQTWMDL